MDPQEARALLADAELIHSEAAVQAALDGVAAAIRARLAEKNPLVLCVMAGGVVFCGRTAAEARFPARFRLPACDALRSRHAGRQDFLADGALGSGKGAHGAGRR